MMTLEIFKKTCIWIACSYLALLFGFACWGSIQEHEHFKLARRCQSAAFHFEIANQRDEAFPELIDKKCYLTVRRGFRDGFSPQETVHIKDGAW